MPIIDLLADSGVASSKGDARRSIQGGGVYLNNVRVQEVERSVRVGGRPGGSIPGSSEGEEELPPGEACGGRDTVHLQSFLKSGKGPAGCFRRGPLFFDLWIVVSGSEAEVHTPAGHHAPTVLELGTVQVLMDGEEELQAQPVALELSSGHDEFTPTGRSTRQPAWVSVL